MNIKIDNYKFDKTARTVTFCDYDSIRLDKIAIITNVTDNIMIYNFVSPTLGGTVSGNVLTLTYDTSTMSDDDKLQIIYDDGNAALLTQLVHAIKSLFQVMANPPWVDKTANQLRAQVTGSISTVTTVTTVTTAASVTNFGTYPAQQGIIDQNRASWAVLVRGRLG